MSFTLVQIECINPDSLITEVIRLTDRHSYNFDGFTYFPDLDKGVDFEEALFSRGTTSGEVKADEGTFVINNTSGRYDRFRFYGFDGQTFRVYKLENEFQVPDESTLYYSLTISYVEFDWSEITLTFKNRLEIFTTPLQVKTFEGTNEGPVGLEGSEDTIKGKVKPRVIGQCLNIPLMPVNTSKLVFACNYDKDGNRAPVEAVWSVLDKGGVLKPEANYADAAALLATEPAEGYYSTCLAEGLIRLGTVPVGDVTADVYSVMGEDASAPRLVRKILEEDYGLEAGSGYDSESLDALHALNAASVGYYVDEEVSGLDVMAALLDSIGGWMAPRLNVLYFGRIDLPVDEGGDIPEFDDDLIHAKSLKKLPVHDEGKGIPAKKVEILHTKLWKVLPKGSVLETISTEKAAYLSEEFRSESAEDADITAAHPLAPSLVFETLLISPRSLKIPELLLADIGAVPSTWDYLNVVGIGSVAVNTEGNGIDMSPDSFGGNNSGVGFSLGVAGPLDTLGIVEELYPCDMVLSFYATAGGGNLSVDVFQDGGLLVTLTNPGDGQVELDFLWNGSSSLEVVFYTTIALGGGANFKNIKLTHKQFGLTVQQECERKLSLLSANTERYDLTIPEKYGRQVFLGQQVRLKSERYDMQDGKPMIVINRGIDDNTNTISLGLYG